MGKVLASNNTRERKEIPQDIPVVLVFMSLNFKWCSRSSEVTTCASLG